MQNLVSTAQNNLSRMVYGNGNAHIAIASAMSATTITVEPRFVSQFYIGQQIKVLTQSNSQTHNTPLTVSAINEATGVITYTTTGTFIGAQKYDVIQLKY